MQIVFVVLLMMLSGLAQASDALAAVQKSINAGHNQADSKWEFKVHTIAVFNNPWSSEFLPDGRLLVSERSGSLYLINNQGEKISVDGLPHVYDEGQNGLLYVATAPNFEDSGTVYISYVEPQGGGGVLTLWRAQLYESGGKAQLINGQVIWQQQNPGKGGHPGGIIAFAPNGDYLFLTVGDRMQAMSAQNMNDSRGKILRMTLDGKPLVSNPWGNSSGVQAYIWTLGHRNPYGLAFDADGKLWSHEMGPKGGDEFNLIEAGKNYGWPLVSNGDQYDGTPIPKHASRPEMQAPLLYWTPVLSPSGLAFYDSELFEQWQGSALIGGLSSQALVRVNFNEHSQPNEVQRLAMGSRIRDVNVDPEGGVWLLEDGKHGRLLKLLPY